MMDWENDGCAHCRERWIWKSDEPQLLGTSMEFQAQVFRCGRCNSYWEETHRFARVITEREAFDRLPWLENQ